MNEKLGFQKQTKGFATKAIHSGQSPDQWKSRAVVPPISLSTTFEQFAPGQHAGFDYSRAANPTRKVLEDCLASLDSAKHALAFSSGVGAQTAITSLVHAGDHIVSSENIYAGINCNFRELAENMGIEVDFVDASDLLEIQNALKPNTKMVWIETPTNPTLKV